MPKRFGISNKVVFAFLSIGLLLCMHAAAQDSTLNIYVNYEGKSADDATILIDGKEVGKTSEDGNFKTSISSGKHTAVANWQGKSGTVTFMALPGSYTDVRIDLK